MKDKILNIVKNKKFIFVAIGVIAIILAIACSGESVGYSELSKTYGGDAYTGIQQAAAQTANNVRYLGSIVRFGFSAVLAVTGLLSIAHGLTFDKKIDYSKDIQAITASIAQLEETVKSVSAPCTCDEAATPEVNEAAAE